MLLVLNEGWILTPTEQHRFLLGVISDLILKTDQNFSSLRGLGSQPPAWTPWGRMSCRWNSRRRSLLALYRDPVYSKNRALPWPGEDLVTAQGVYYWHTGHQLLFVTTKWYLPPSLQRCLRPPLGFGPEGLIPKFIATTKSVVQTRWPAKRHLQMTCIQIK